MIYVEISKLYNRQAKEYLSFEKTSYSWQYIEKPGFEKYISDLLNEKTKVLDFGCGGGRSIQYLLSKGVKPENVTGTDISEEMINHAKEVLPKEVTLICRDIKDAKFGKGIFDLITSNMVFSYLDNSSIEIFLETAYDLLREDGRLFFITTDPDGIRQTYEKKNEDKWLNVKSPWGTEIPYFNRSMHDLLLNYLDLAGFDYERGWMLNVIDEGKVNPVLYEKYKIRPSRVAGRYKKVSEEAKLKRNLGELSSLI